jgi:hypothetical protein
MTRSPTLERSMVLRNSPNRNATGTASLARMPQAETNTEPLKLVDRPRLPHAGPHRPNRFTTAAAISAVARRRAAPRTGVTIRRAVRVDLTHRRPRMRNAATATALK